MEVGVLTEITSLKCAVWLEVSIVWLSVRPETQCCITVSAKSAFVVRPRLKSGHFEGCRACRSSSRKEETIIVQVSRRLTSVRKIKDGTEDWF
ncbi:hypothetical protein TNCV_3585091 [Trichonephila clavipes]|nr:hypothetical protein TNCV_3585091 [Trichonephila clavipes]